MIPDIQLSDGRRIPQVGLGLWKVSEEEFNSSFDAAVATGYRHFDTAQVYGNEGFLGTAWKRHELQREELFITTKIRVENITVGRAKSSLEGSLERLQTEYVDLLLLHFPVSLMRKKAWKDLEALKAAGKAKSIGVSNYTVKHLEEMKGYASEMPVVNQVELHVFLQQPELVDYCRQHNIQLEAYSPLAHARAGADEPVLQEIAQKHGKTFAQIMLRWCVQSGFVVLPKSVTPSRVKENAEIFNFELDDEDQQQLKGLDRDLRTCWDPTHVP
ncbi:MAG: aldo/keto reductase [Candidatus Saccharimonadales bacterium]